MVVLANQKKLLPEPWGVSAKEKLKGARNN